VVNAEDATSYLIRAIPEIQSILQDDIVAAYEGDPAAKSTMEVVMSYPGMYAITVHRIAHLLYEKDVPLIPRIMSEYAHSRTGIDIHPGARIGSGFFIDHGTGVVIGETCVIGRNVKLYQGVTLGALSFEKDAQGRLVKGTKRHPNVEDHVVIYAGATILGGETTIGAHSEIGGNVWLIHSVPPHSRVYNQQPRPLIRQAQGRDRSVNDYGDDLGQGI
jgi:serine O-acetyltransferase